jgi:hypothetical protein
MNYSAAELRGIKMNFCLINPDAEHRGILLIKSGKGKESGGLRWNIFRSLTSNASKPTKE